jgi:hypothetical protein
MNKQLQIIFSDKFRAFLLLLFSITILIADLIKSELYAISMGFAILIGLVSYFRLEKHFKLGIHILEFAFVLFATIYLLFFSKYDLIIKATGLCLLIWSMISMLYTFKK